MPGVRLVQDFILLTKPGRSTWLCFPWTCSSPPRLGPLTANPNTPNGWTQQVSLRYAESTSPDRAAWS